MAPPASVYYTDAQFEDALEWAKVTPQQAADLRAWRGELRYRVARLLRTRQARRCQALYTRSREQSRELAEKLARLDAIYEDRKGPPPEVLKP